MKFDVRPIPSAVETGFTSRYMEAKVLEDIKVLNEITENYSLGYLSESCAFTMLDIISQNEDRLMEAAMDADDTIGGMSIKERLNAHISPLQFVGEGVLPYKEIVKANDGESLYKAYTMERTWDGEDAVYEMASKIADAKENELRIYKESSGEKGFTEYERALYKNYPDDRVTPDFLYERAIESKILSGSITLEEGYILQEFVESRFAVNEDVAVMMPVVPLNGDVLSPDLTNTSVKDMVSATDSEAAENNDDPTDPDEDCDVIYGTIKVEESVGYQLRDAGAFVALEGVVYKNNIVFDSEMRKLFDKLKKDLKLSKPDDQASFKAMINVKKNRYTFNFANEKANPTDITTSIVSCGFKPIKENGIVVKYEKVSKGIKITVEFTSVDNGVIAFYENSDTVVKESSLEDKINFGIDCDASDVKDAAKKVKKLRADKDTKKEDFDQAVSNLDHAIENYKKVQKAQKDEEVKESANDLLASIRSARNVNMIYREWLLESCVDHLTSDHPLFCKNREAANAYVKEAFDVVNKALRFGSRDQFVEERVATAVNMINESIPSALITESTFVDYINEILVTSPVDKVCESCYELLEAVHDGSITEFAFTETVKMFTQFVQYQMDDESVCERILNDIEFREEVFNESGDKIDDDIQSTVELLNRLGYKVKYSSAGHSKTRIKEDNHRDGVYHGKLYTTARITFDKHYDLKSVPDGWYENKNSDKTAIYVRAFTYNPKDGTPNEAFEKWKASYIKALKDWVDNLSEAKDPEATTESVISDFENELMNGTTPMIVESPEVDFDSFMESEIDALN